MLRFGAVRTFAEFRLAVLDEVSAATKSISGTPPTHFVVENELGGFDFVGPIWKDQAEKQRAPDTMRTWIREHRPHRLAVVGEAFAVDRPTENERSLPPSQNPRRRHVVDVWLFERGRPGAESWEADVLTREDGLIHLSDWRAFAMPGAIQNGFLFDPVLDAMSETPSGGTGSVG